MAAPLSGHLSKLDAVNELLFSVGEDEVSSLASGLTDAELAEKAIDRASRRIQLQGWHCNTKRALVLTKNSDNQFALPINTLKVDTVNPNKQRVSSSPPYSRHINAVMKRSADDTKFLLYDVDNNSETWSSETQITVDLVQFLEFEHLTPSLQDYITKLAGRQFQKGLMGSRVLFEFTQQDVDEALEAALQEDAENEDTNMIFDNPHVHAAVYRNNPFFGR